MAKWGRGAEAADVVDVAETARSEKVTDANHAWRWTEFILIKRMEYNLMEISEEILVGSRNIGGVCAVSNGRGRHRGQLGQASA